MTYSIVARDAATGDMADLGTGVIDFPAIFRKHQVEEYIVENDTPDVSPLTTAAVGHAAFTNGVELHELRSESSGLEEIYFRLTAGQEQYAATAPQEASR